MNKKRLLLFSVFALVHITTSERSFIDGRCCNHSTRSLSSDSSFSTYETHRVQRFLPAIRQLNKPEKYPNSNKRETELTQLLKRRQIDFTRRGSGDGEVREIVERHEKKNLTNPPAKLKERQNLRERTRERSNALQNDLRRNRFSTYRDRQYQRNFRISSLSRNSYTINDVTRNLLINRDAQHDAHIRNTRDNRNEIRPKAPELVERNTRTERYTNRINVRNDFDLVKYTESREFPQKTNLERAVRLERNIRIKRSGRIIVVNRLANEHNSRLGRYRNLDENLSQNESSRKSFVRNNVRSEDRMDLKYNKKSSVLFNEINGGSVRVADANVRNVAELKRGTQNLRERLELRETSRLQKDYSENRYERTTRKQSDPLQRLDRIDVSRERENRISISSRSSDEKYPTRDHRNDARFQFDRRNINDNARYNRGLNQREISEEREERINISLDRNNGYINSRRIMERNTVDSRLGNKIRSPNDRDYSDINENSLSFRRSHNERAFERGNKRTTRQKLQTEEFRERNSLRQFERIQRNINDVSDRMGRRNREALSYSAEFRERDDSRRNIRESRYDRSIENRVIIERGDRQQSDKRHETINERSRNNNLERRFENRLRLTIRQDQNRISSKSHRNAVTDRNGNQIAKANIEDDLRHRSRSLSNDNRLTDSRDDTRDTDDETRQTRKTQERPINIRRTGTLINERRESMMEFSDSRRSMITHKTKYENPVFEMKWQYLFYALQLVYLCSILMKIPKENEGNKHKRFADWFTPAEYLKID